MNAGRRYQTLTSRLRDAYAWAKVAEGVEDSSFSFVAIAGRRGRDPPQRASGTQSCLRHLTGSRAAVRLVIEGNQRRALERLHSVRVGLAL